jgi:AraC-like DNA-binding protein
MAKQLERIAGGPTERFSERVIDALQFSGLRPSECSREAIARRFAMSERTLQRRLEREGTTFSQVLGALRRKAALDLMRDPQRRVREISDLLGFADQSSFNKTFRRWTGCSPSAYRSHHAK